MSVETGKDGTEGVDVPIALVAITRKIYGVPAVKPVIKYGELLIWHEVQADCVQVDPLLDEY